MDLQMPEMNGFEATEYIRNTMNSKIPIIALTADVTAMVETKCKAVGMNDYLSKPVDEKLLYSKIMVLVKKTVLKNKNESLNNENEENEQSKYINLNSLINHAKSDPKLMMEMISLYLQQTPSLISTMKQNLNNKDWSALQQTVHKMIPSFSTTGISMEFENLVKKVREHANSIQLLSNGMPELLAQLEKKCIQASTELEQEFNILKKRNYKSLHIANSVNP